MEVDEFNNFNPQKEVTREELAKIIYYLYGGEKPEGEIAVVTPFYDVKPNDENALYINFVNSEEYMVGFDDSQFRPKQRITYNETLKTLISMLGLDVMAELSGGYPNGYIAQAHEEDISIGLSGSDTVTKEELAQMIFNALQTEVLGMNIEGVSTDISLERGETLLKILYDIEEVEGIVTKDGYTALTQRQGFNSNNVEINGVTYTNLSAESYLGYYVNAYVSYENDADGEIISMIPAEKRNNYREFYAEDIISVSLDKIEYETEDSNETIKLEAGFDLIYNGKARLDYKASDLKPAYGNIRLIDNDRDNKYEVVFVDNLEYKQISRVNSTSGTVYFNDSSYLKIDFDSDEYSYLFNSDGEKKALKSLKANAILGYAQESDFTVLYQSTLIAEGLLSQISDEYITIDGIQYEVSANCDTENIDVNSTVIAYFDNHNKVSVLEKQLLRTNEMYAYVIRSGYDESEQTGFLKVFDQSGAETMFIYEELKVNKNTLPALNASSLIEKGSIVKITVNNENILKSVVTAEDKTTVQAYEGYTDKIFTKDYVNKSARYIGSPQSSFGGKFIVDNGTLIFYCEEDGDDVKVQMIKKSTLIHYTKPYNVTIYDCDNELNAGILHIVSKSKSKVKIEESSASYIVDSIKAVLNEDDEVINQVTLMRGGKSYVAKLSDDVLNNSEVYYIYNKTKYPDLFKGEFSIETDIKKGDVIQYSKNSKGEIDNVVVLFSTSKGIDEIYNEKEYVEGGKTKSDKNNNYQKLWTGYGVVEKVFNSRFLLKTNNNDLWIRNVVPSSNIYVNEKGKIRYGSYNDIDIGDKVFVHNVYQDNSTIYIVK